MQKKCLLVFLTALALQGVGGIITPVQAVNRSGPVQAVYRPKPAYFRFVVDKETMVVQVNDPAKIAQFRAALASRDRPGVEGKVICGLAPYNRTWHFYLDPNSVALFTHEIEVCDAAITNIDEGCKQGLARNIKWCPWGSSLEEEVFINSLASFH